MKPSCTVIAVFAMALLAVQAQAETNFSGEWKLNAAKSDFGPAPAPEVMKRTIKHSGPSLQISTYQKGVQGESTTELKYTTDGKECVNKLPTGESKGTATWQGDNLVVDSTRDFQGTEIKFHETWSLSEGGTVLIITNHITHPQGEFDAKFVFDKQ